LRLHELHLLLVGGEVGDPLMSEDAISPAP